MTDTPPDVPIISSRKSFMERASLVWLVPLAALAIALGVAWQSYSDRGPLIEIRFNDANGIHKGETQLRYRDVAVGLVEKVGFSEDLDNVVVSVRLDKDVAPYVDQDSQFWVVEPEVSARGVSGLDTVLSGVYIEGFWDQTAGGLAYEFVGEEDAPLEQVGRTGTRITLRAISGAVLSAGSPIIYKGIEVGRMGPPKLAGDGSTATADAVVYAPYDRLVSTATRFWDTSGFTFSLGANGAQIDFSSLATLIGGGVSFETVISGGEPVDPGTVFSVYPDETSARNSIFSEGQSGELALLVVFDENVSGLSGGAPVELGGVRVGEVSGLSGLVDPERFGDERVRLQATLEIFPGRLGLSDGESADDALDFLESRIASGLRARLASASILTGGLKVELFVDETAPPATLDRTSGPFPTMPSAPSEISDVAATAEGVFQRVNNLPIEELMQSAIGFLDNASVLISDGELRSIPGEVAGILGDVRTLTSSDAVQGMPGQISVLLSDLQTASGDLRELMSALESQDAISRLLTAVDAAGRAAASADIAFEALPSALRQVEILAADITTLDLDALVNETTSLLDAAETLLADEATRTLPGELQETVAQLQSSLEAFNTGDGIGRLLAAVDAAGSAARGVEDATTGLPQLLASLTELSDSAAELPLERVVSELTALLDSAETLLSDPDTRALPGTARDALAALDVALDRFNEAEGMERLLAAIDAADQAAENVSASVEGLPALMTEIGRVAEMAADLPLESLVAQVSGLVDSADKVVRTPGARELPGALSDALGQIEAVLADLRQGGTVENVNSTLASTADAAQAIAVATEDLPRVIARIDTLLSQATSTLSSFDATSPLNREVREALREVSRAAEAVDSLARTIERRPNSIILGR